MANKTAKRDDKQRGGLPQEETGGPGARDKQQNQEADGQLGQFKKNQREEEREQQGGGKSRDQHH